MHYSVVVLPLLLFGRLQCKSTFLSTDRPTQPNLSRSLMHSKTKKLDLQKRVFSYEDCRFLGFFFHQKFI